MVALADFIHSNSVEIAARAAARSRERRAGASTRAPGDAVDLVAEIVERLRPSAATGPTVDERAAGHGAACERTGGTIDQVVHDYGDLGQAIAELASARQTTVESDDVRALTGCLADATARAVAEFARQREASMAAQGAERLGSLGHELRNRLAAATLSFSILKKGNVALGGSTGAVLGRSLKGLQEIVDLALANARTEARAQGPRRLSVFDLLGEMEVEAAMNAQLRGITLTVVRGERGVDVDADHQVLSGVITNLVQNAVKFTPPSGHVRLQASATRALVTIEVEDECGGLSADVESLFLPFVQRNQDRSGLGLGLAISQKGVAASGGRLQARDLPGKGCVFWIELPRLSPAEASRGA